MDAARLNRRKLYIWLTIIAIGAIVVTLRTARGNSDLAGFHRVWAANWENPTAENRPDPEDPYSPAFYVIFAPLGAIPLWGAALLIYAINVGCTLGIMQLTCRLLNIPKTDRAWLWVPALGVAPFFIGTLSLGQNTLMLMLLVMAAYCLAAARHDTRAGMLLGVAAAIKVYPILFLAPFVLQRRIKLVGAFLLTILIIAGGLGSLFFGPHSNLEWHRQWAAFVTRSDQSRAEDPHYPRTMRCSARYNNQAVQAVLARLTLDVPARWTGRQFKVNLFSFDAATWRTLRTTALVLFLLIGIVALNWFQTESGRAMLLPHHVQEDAFCEEPITHENERAARELALVSAWFFVTSPMLWTHYLVWAFFPLAYMTQAKQITPRRAKTILAIWFIAEALVWSQSSRAVGLNLLAGTILFAWCAAPGLQYAMRTFVRWQRFPSESPAAPTGLGA